MSEINQRKGNMVSAQEVSIFALKANQQLLELVTPRKATLNDKAAFISLLIKKAFAPALRSFAVARVFFDVWHQSMIETGLACGFGVKSRIGMKQHTADFEAEPLERLESCF